MKYIKAFENINNEPEVGDYVLCEDQSIAESGKLKIFTLNNVGIIISLNSTLEATLKSVLPKYLNIKYDYVIEYEEVPFVIEYLFTNNKRGMDREEIIFYSKDRDVVESYITAMRYNL